MKVAVAALALALLPSLAMAQDVRLIDPSDPAYPRPPPNSLTRQQTLDMIDKANPGARKRAREQLRVERSERRPDMELDLPPWELQRRRCNATRGRDCE
jgi:hypothetical protein